MSDKSRLRFTSKELALFGAPLLVLLFAYLGTVSRSSKPRIVVTAIATNTPKPSPTPPAIKSISLLPDEKTLITCSTENTVKTWDTRTGAFLKTISMGWGTISSPNLPLSPNGKFFATITPFPITSTSPPIGISGLGFKSGSERNILSLINPASGQTVRQFSPSHAIISAIAFSPDSRLVAVASEPDPYDIISTTGLNSIDVWDTSTGKVKGRWGKGICDIRSLAFAPDGKSLTIVGSLYKKSPPTHPIFETFAMCWSLSSRILQWKVAPPEIEMGSEVTYFTGAKRVAMSGTQPVILDAQTGAKRMTLSVPRSRYRNLTFSPRSQFLLGTDYAQNILFWDAERGNLLFRRSKFPAKASTITLSRDGQTLITGDSEGVIKIWNISPLHLERREVKHQLLPRLAPFLTIDTNNDMAIYTPQTQAPPAPRVLAAKVD